MKYIKKFKIFESVISPKIIYYQNGQKRSETYYNNYDQKHREDGPAYIEWYKNGQKLNENYYINNKLYRENGPSINRWYENGKKEVEIYTNNNKIHREDGPAAIEWFDNGEIMNKYYYIYDDLFKDKIEWLEKLKEIGSLHYEEQKMLDDIERFNL